MYQLASNITILPCPFEYEVLSKLFRFIIWFGDGVGVGVGLGLGLGLGLASKIKE